VDVDRNSRIVGFDEKPAFPKPMPGRPDRALSSMGNYLFNTDVLLRALEENASEERAHDFGKDILPRLLHRERVMAYNFQDNEIPGLAYYEEPGYWRDVGTVESYWAANMDFLSPTPPLPFDDPAMRIRTSGALMAPAYAGPRSTIHNALVSPAARIDGTVLRSVISPGVTIEEGAEVRDSVIQHRCVIRSGAVVDRCILDKEVIVGKGCVVGEGDESIVNRERPDIVNAGISVVGKRVTIPPGLRIGRNVVIGPGVERELHDFKELPCGTTVHPTQIPLHLFV
ncbi:hypothetical protein EDM76_13165, partial [bacterium]